MSKDDWTLQKVNDVVFLLTNDSDDGSRDLRKRFKSDPEAFKALYMLLDEIGEDSASYGFNKTIYEKKLDKRIRSISNNKNIFELRKFSDLWRVIVYLSQKSQCLVIIDAFLAHKNKSHDKAVSGFKKRIKIVKKMLGEDE